MSRRETVNFLDKWTENENKSPMSDSLLRWMPMVYGLSFFALGSSSPYLALELQERGVTELSLLLAFPAICNVLLGPIWGIVADATKAWGLLFRLCAILTALSMMAVALADAVWLFWAVLIWSVSRTPLWPLSDALALEAVQGDVSRYGRLRLWGSIGFMAGVIVASAYRAYFGGAALILASGIWLCFFGLTLFLPSPKQMPPQNLKKALKVLLSDPVLALILLVSALHFGAHFAASTFLSTHIQDLGYSDNWTGAAIGLGVFIEIGVMAQGTWFLKRFTAAQCFTMATAIAVSRWFLMTQVSAPLAIVCTRGLHGFSFGLFWISVVALVSKRSPAEAPASGQALLGAAVGGVGAGVGVYWGAWIVEGWGTYALYQWALSIACIALILAGGLLWWLSRPTKNG